MTASRSGARHPHAVFVYGTLLLDSTRGRIVGRHVPTRPATLPGYRRRALSARPYPGIRPAADEQTAGALIQVSPRELQRLDAYEGPEYLRRRETVKTDTGERRTAFVYVLRRRHATLMTDRPWTGRDYG